MPGPTCAGALSQGPYADRVSAPAELPTGRRPGRPDALVAHLWRSIALAAVLVPPMLLLALWQSGTAPAPAATSIAVAALVITSTAVLTLSGTGTGTGDAPAPRGVLLAAGSGLFAGQLALVAWTPGGGCLPAVGRGAQIGLHLTLMRPDASCPQGTLALTETGSTAATLLGTAFAVLLAHLIAALVGVNALPVAEHAAAVVTGTGPEPAPLTRARRFSGWLAAWSRAWTAIAALAVKLIALFGAGRLGCPPPSRRDLAERTPRLLPAGRRVTVGVLRGPPVLG